METIEHLIKYPTEQKHETPIMLQHGAWHGAWCWELWLDYFAELGYEVHAISLPGHGNSSQNKRHINLYSLGNYVEALANEIDKLSTKPIVIGHSMGGAVVQKYLQHHSPAGAVLLATLPSKGVLNVSFRLLKTHPVAILKSFLTMSMYRWVETPKLAQSLFLNEESEVDVSNSRKLTGKIFTLNFRKHPGAK